MSKKNEVELESRSNEPLRVSTKEFQLIVRSLAFVQRELVSLVRLHASMCGCAELEHDIETISNLLERFKPEFERAQSVAVKFCDLETNVSCVVQ